MKVGRFVTNQQTLDTDMVSALGDQIAMVPSCARVAQGSTLISLNFFRGDVRGFFEHHAGKREQAGAAEKPGTWRPTAAPGKVGRGVRAAGCRDGRGIGLARMTKRGRGQ
jgi:hypothetical protein